MTSDGFKLSQDMLKEWIVDDLTLLLTALNDNRYDIFNSPDTLKRIQDNIKTLYEDYEP